MNMARYDVAIIGAGPGGYSAALKLAQLGKKTVLIENHKLGGECLNYGCIPSKTIISASNLFDKISNFNEQGIECDNLSINLPKFQSWKDSIIKKLNKGIEILCKNYNVTIIFGTAKIKTKNVIQVKSNNQITEISTDNIIIATGSQPKELQNLQFDQELIVSSKEMLEIKTIPRNILVVGGGAIGLELGTAFAKIGSKVTIVEITDSLLPGIDKDLVNVVKKSLNNLNVDVFFHSKILHVEKYPTKIKITIESNKNKIEKTFDKILISIGRIPSTKNLGLETIGINTDNNGFVEVDKNMMCNIPGIYAIGDITGPPWLAHKASTQGVKVAHFISKSKEVSQNYNIPYAVFTEPEIATIGISEEEALRKNIKIKVGKFQFAANARALTSKNTDGFVKVVTDQNSNKILGVHIVGSDASNLIGEASLALTMNVKIEDIENTIHPHPTLTEAFMEAAEASLNRSIHSFIKKI